MTYDSLAPTEREIDSQTLRELAAAWLVLLGVFIVGVRVGHRRSR